MKEVVQSGQSSTAEWSSYLPGAQGDIFKLLVLHHALFNPHEFMQKTNVCLALMTITECPGHDIMKCKRESGESARRKAEAGKRNQQYIRMIAG